MDITCPGRHSGSILQHVIYNMVTFSCPVNEIIDEINLCAPKRNMNRKGFRVKNSDVKNISPLVLIYTRRVIGAIQVFGYSREVTKAT